MRDLCQYRQMRRSFVVAIVTRYKVEFIPLEAEIVTDSFQ